MALELNKSKLPWHPERVALWYKGVRIAPITVDMALTQACNYDCEFCYGQLQQHLNMKPWTWDMIRWTLDDFKELGVKAVSLVSDGESTINNLYPDTIRHARLNGLDVALGTNGYLLDYEKLERILPHLTYLRFNISAARHDRYCQIHGVTDNAFWQVLNNIRDAVSIKHECGLRVTIGMQMVFAPKYVDQIIPLTYLAQGLGVDYFQIKHCSDDERGTLGVTYDDYALTHEVLEQAEKANSDHFQVIVKWDKIKAGNKRCYENCYAPPFQLQISGSGVVAPCGMFFHPRYFRYHIGNLHNDRFRDLWKSERYWEVMSVLKSRAFNPQVACGCLCLQDAANIYLNDLVEGRAGVQLPGSLKPQHVNFI